jgi:hypothetical protein
VDVGTIITVGVLGQAALLIGMGYWGAERIVGTLASSVHRADHQRVEDRIRAFSTAAWPWRAPWRRRWPWRRPAATAPPRPS